MSPGPVLLLLTTRGRHLPSSWTNFPKPHTPVTHHQCWGKLLLKVMHYNIALLPKKVTNYVT